MTSVCMITSVKALHTPLVTGGARVGLRPMSFGGITAQTCHKPKQEFLNQCSLFPLEAVAGLPSNINKAHPCAHRAAFSGARGGQGPWPL